MKSIIKNGSLYVFGNLFNKAIAFITVPIFTRMLTTEEYGIVNTYTSWVSLLAVFIGLGLGQTIRNAYVDMREELGKYISSIFTLAGVNFAFISIIVTCIYQKINLPIGMVWLCLIESFGNFIVNSLLMKYVMEEEAVKRTLLMVFPNLFGAILSVGLIWMLQKDKQYGRILGTCISTALFGFGIFVFYLRKYRTFFQKDIWKYALSISIPIIFHGISCNILGASDRSIITYFCGASETGIYSLIYNLGMVSNVFVSSAESVWIPRMTYGLIQHEYKKVNQDIKVYIYVVTFVFCGLLTIAPELVLLMGGKEYLSGMTLIFPIVASSFMMFMYSIYVNIEYFYKKTKIIASSTILAALVNLILNFVFIPQYGALAASYTTLVSYSMSFILHSINARKLNAEIAPYKILFLPIVIILIAGIITTILKDALILRYSIMISLGLVYIVAVWKRIFSI